MPVSGNEETGVKPVSWKYSDYIAGVPIKKRRFPMMRPPSPPPEEPSFPPSNTDSVQKEQSSQLEGSTISHATFATSSGISDATEVQPEGSTISRASESTTGISDATNVPECDDRRGRSDVQNVNTVRGNENIVRVKVEQPSVRVHLSSSEELQRKGKFVMADNPVPQMTLGRNELSLRPTEVPIYSFNKDIIHGKRLAVVKCEEVMPATAESTELSLSLKERLFPDLTCQKGDKGVSHPSQDNSDPISLNSDPISLSLSLSEEKLSSRCKSNGKDLKVHGAQMQSCRANWDLNTPMDAWEDPSNDDPVSADRINAKGGAHAVSSIGMIEGGVSSERQSIAENQKRTNLTMLSKLGSQECKSNDSLLLRLNSCSLPNLCQGPSSSFGFDLDRRGSANLTRVAGPTNTLNLGNYRTVKPEPFDERVKQEPSSVGPLRKPGVVDRSIIGAIKSSNVSTQKFVDPRSIKTEPAVELNQEMSKSTKGESVQQDKHLINGLDDRSSGMKLPVAAGVSGPAGKPSCLTEFIGQPSSELTVTQDVIDQSGDSSAKLSHKACQSNEKVVVPLGHDSKVNNLQTKEDKVDNPNRKLKLMNVQPLDSCGSGGTSDEEKLNISTDMLEDSYGTDYESDGNHVIDTAIKTKREGKDDDYEDGEVRDSLLGAAVQDELMCEARQVENANNDDFKNVRTECAGPVNIVFHTPCHAEAKDIKTDDLAGTSNDNDEESCDVDSNAICDKGCDEVCLREPSFAEKLTSSEGLKGSISTVTTEPINDQSGMRDSRICQDAQLSSEQVTMESQGPAVATALDTELNVSKAEPVQTSESTLSKTSGSGDNVSKDTSTEGQRSRIINLPRSLNGSPSRSLSIPGQAAPSRAGTELLRDVTAVDEHLHPQGRGETYFADMNRFPRERFQDQSWRNSRVNFGRGRGRMNNRGDWSSSSDRYMAAEHYYNQTKYRIPRYKYVNDVSEPDLEYNNFNSDAAFVGRGGRKLSNDGPVNHRIPSRRRSPIGEHIVQVPRGNLRNFSPSRCINEDTSDLVGTRHNEKLVRGFPVDSVDSMFTRTQPSYEGDGQFGRGRGNRSYSFVQRRGFRIRSKSPIRTRTRSPGPWSSPRGRSPDGFGGPGAHRPPYRMERFRSPDGASFTGEMVVRRNPPNELRDMDTGRDRGHQRSGIHRSPSSRVLLRNRRYDVIDPRERADNNEFFAGGGPMYSSRVHDIGGDGNGEERRRFGERRGPVRTFRPPYNSADDETFQVNTENCPRPFRFCPDGETEFQERGNLRDRDVDRRIKNRPGNAPRRMRSIEDQEGTFRSDGQPWNNGGFDDISSAKRKRF